MRPLLSLKTLLRAPFKTLMTFLLIAASSFAVFYCIVDYSVTQREMKRSTTCYRGVAALDNGIVTTAQQLASQLPNSAKYGPEEYRLPPTALTSAQIKAFSELPGVGSTDTRYMTAGIIDGLKRVARYGDYDVKYDYTDRFVIEGTYTGYETSHFGISKIYNIELDDYKQLAGGIPLPQGSHVSIVLFEGAAGITRGDMRCFYFLNKMPFGKKYLDKLEKGQRCLIIGRWDPRFLVDDGFMSLFIGDQDTDNYCKPFYALKDKPSNYLDTDEFAKVRELVDITNRDLKTFDMVYTSDLLSVPRFNERKMVIQKGRALTKEDQNSCVVNQALLMVNGLKIGDKITVNLCDKLLEQHEGMGATAVIPERYGAPVKNVELKIVGSYVDTDTQAEREGDQWWGYSPNTIFVSTSLLPIKVPDDHQVKPGEFSLVIDNAREMKKFVDQARPLAKSMGMQLRFSDSGWFKVKDSINTNQETSLIMSILYLSAAAVALLLVTYLYIGRGAKTYAIMRALGTPRKKARRSLLLPLGVLSVLAIPIGGIAGVVNASKAISDALAKLAATTKKYAYKSLADKQFVPDESIPFIVVFLCLICIVVFLSLLCVLFMRRLAQTPPLALLQGNTANRRAKKKAKYQSEDEVEIPKFAPELLVGLKMPEHGKYSFARHITSYILKHIRRAKWKAILVVLLAVLLTGTIGMLTVIRLSYQELYDKIEVKGSLSNYPSSGVMEASHSKLMKDFYYSGGYSVICNGAFSTNSNSLYFTNNLDRYVKTKSKYQYTIKYLDGYDASLFSDNKAECVLGSFQAEALGVVPGDHITMLSYKLAYGLSSLYKNKEELDARIKKMSQEFTVVGVITSKDPSIGLGIYTPISEETEKMSEYVEYPFSIEKCSFVLANKDNPYKLRDYLDDQSGLDHKYLEAVSYKLDTTELDNVKRMRDILTQLFPLAAAGAILIGLIAPILIIIQSAKEAAMLRILGTTKLRTRCMLALEQIGLCVIGLVLASVGLVVYNAGLFIRSTDTLILCGGLYLLSYIFAVAITSIRVTSHKVLELLQVKE